MSRTIAVIGGGPSGLAAAYELAREGARVLVLEQLNDVGGLSRTMKHDGCLFDVGPHRFFTKNEEVRQFYLNVLAEDAVIVPRLTRILYENRLFNYPLTPLNVVGGLGPAECIHVVADYALAQLRNIANPREAETFEDWVEQRFGRRLYEAFFKTYTEKVWGIPCTDISADWAAQRIKSLSLPQAIRNALLKDNGGKVKSLVNEFLFPRLGSGQFYEKIASFIKGRGGVVRRGCRVQRVIREDRHVRAIVVDNGSGLTEEIETGFVLSSAPLTELVEMMTPDAPDAIEAARKALRYRDHLGVHLKVEGSPFPDNWIYVHSKNVRVARISNYRNFSKEMAGQGADVSPLTAEYFTFKSDDLWRSSDDSLVSLATAEMKRSGLLHSEKQVLSGFVLRSEKAYPMMELGYEKNIALIKTWLDGFDNLLPIGRSGMFKYNNQDHAIATGLLAARTALGIGSFDPWLVNIDAEYHEETRQECLTSAS